MPDAIIYSLGVLSGAALIIVTRKYMDKAAKIARKEAYREYEDRQSMRTEAFNRGYARARQDYHNMSEVERFADTFNGRNVKMHYREVRQH